MSVTISRSQLGNIISTPAAQHPPGKNILGHRHGSSDLSGSDLPTAELHGIKEAEVFTRLGEQFWKSWVI